MNTLITLLIPLLAGLVFALLVAGIFITLSRRASMGQFSEQSAGRGWEDNLDLLSS